MKIRNVVTNPALSLCKYISILNLITGCVAGFGPTTRLLDGGGGGGDDDDADDDEAVEVVDAGPGTWYNNTNTGGTTFAGGGGGGHGGHGGVGVHPDPALPPVEDTPPCPPFEANNGTAYGAGTSPRLPAPKPYYPIAL